MWLISFKILIIYSFIWKVYKNTALISGIYNTNFRQNNSQFRVRLNRKLEFELSAIFLELQRSYKQTSRMSLRNPSKAIYYLSAILQYLFPVQRTTYLFAKLITKNGSRFSTIDPFIADKGKFFYSWKILSFIK